MPARRVFAWEPEEQWTSSEEREKKIEELSRELDESMDSNSGKGCLKAYLEKNEVWHIADIDYENHEIRVDFRDDNENDARAKNAEERRGRVSDDTFEFLLYYIGEYWDILQKQEYLFINIKGDTIGKPLRVDSVYDMFERMEKKTGIKITPHMLRRYYANTRWEADWPLEMISQALGHKHLDTTIRYLNVLDDKLKTASQEFYRRYSKLYGVEQFLESRR